MRISGYDFMNMLAVFENSLALIIFDINKGNPEGAKLRAINMMLTIRKLEGHGDADDQ